MEFRSTSDRKFLNSATKLLKENKEIVILVRHPNRCGAKDFLIFVDENNFIDFTKRLEVGDSLTVFTSIETIWKGNLNEFLKINAISKLKKYDNQWLLSIENNSYAPYLKGKYKWTLTETLEELEEELTENFKNEITIFLEPDFCDENIILHAYAPNKFGVGKAKGSY